ncbi:MAG: hypothetical protein FWB83_08495 [Treponema sp.]|nr:hypothetical protein [Treponema sp.]
MIAILKPSVILFILLTAAVPVFSNDVFFPTRPGAVQLTANLNAGGRVEGYNRQVVTDVRTSGSDMTVIYTVQILDRNRRPVRNSGEREYSVNISDGVLIYRLDNMMDAFFASREMNYTMTAGNFLVPSNMAPGSRLEDTWMNMSVRVPIIGTVTAQSAMTDIVCTGIEMVTVPAGTFEAYRVTQLTTTTTTGWGRSPIVNNGVSWYVRGIGVVKSVNYDSRGRVESSTELHELIR